MPEGIRPEASHGGPDALGVPRHDFSTNSNAAGPCSAALAALHRAPREHYPDPGYAALHEALADFHRVDPARVVLAASASEFIFRISAQVACATPGAQVWLPAHGYGDYARAAAAWGLMPARAAGQARLLWACDPSSPLGAPEQDLAARITRLAAHQTCVLDLAYEPLRLQGQLALAPQLRDRVWQLWTPNKALGCTGVRAAYAIAPRGGEDQAARLRALAPSWPLGADGVALLQAWTGAEAQAWLAQSLQTLRDWKSRQQATCIALGWQLQASVANFFCAAPNLPDLPRALARLRQAGIKLRDTASFGLPGQVRLGVLPPAAQDALQAAWITLKAHF
jgi:histidinol-phosphate aminotransferase